MLFFNFNTSNYDESKYVDSLLGDFSYIKEVFRERVCVALGIDSWLVAPSFYEEIGVPCTSFLIDDELAKTSHFIKGIASLLTELPFKEFDNKSLRDLGIDIDFCNRIPNDELDEILYRSGADKGYEYLAEELLWKKMNDEQKVNKICEYLDEINVKDNKLIIIDPYFFASLKNNYCEMVSEILNASGAKSIVIVTDKINPGHYIEQCYLNIKNKVNNKIEVKNNGDFHDRFWLVPNNKGFCMGTSLNGIGKRISIITMLSKSDFREICDVLYEYQLL